MFIPWAVVLIEIRLQNDTLERLMNERFAIYRRCKMDQIELPLLEGDLSQISMDEVSAFSLETVSVHR